MTYQFVSQHKANVLYQEDVVVREPAIETLRSISEKLQGEAFAAFHPVADDVTEEDRVKALEAALTYAVSAVRAISTVMSLAQGGVVLSDGPTSLGFFGVMEGAAIDRDKEFTVHT
jgi:hypothetical protein